jgi:hypothetical protein
VGDGCDAIRRSGCAAGNRVWGKGILTSVGISRLMVRVHLPDRSDYGSIQTLFWQRLDFARARGSVDAKRLYDSIISTDQMDSLPEGASGDGPCGLRTAARRPPCQPTAGALEGCSSNGAPYGAPCRGDPPGKTILESPFRNPDDAPRGACQTRVLPALTLPALARPPSDRTLPA